MNTVQFKNTLHPFTHQVLKDIPAVNAPIKQITIDITGSRPHIGKTLMAGVIARALADAGFTNVTVNAPEGGVDTTSHNIVERTIDDAILSNTVVINDLNSTQRPDLTTQITALAADLTQAASTLRRYETQHRAKGTAESSEKAEVNAALATRFEATLAGIERAPVNAPKFARGVTDSIVMIDEIAYWRVPMSKPSEPFCFNPFTGEKRSDLDITADPYYARWGSQEFLDWLKKETPAATSALPAEPLSVPGPDGTSGPDSVQG